MRKRDVRSYHQALREHYDGSAPNLYPDHDLTLLIAAEGVRDHLTYLVWRETGEEPEIWSYQGLETYKFKNLADHLTWLMKKE